MMQEPIMARMPLVDAVIVTSRVGSDLRQVMGVHNAKRPNFSARAFRLSI